MNEDHAEAIRLYATKLLDAEGGPWRISGIDPEGTDLMLDDVTLRLPFPSRVATAAELRTTLVNLAAQARAG
jgi:heme iron utilization protein